MKKLSIVAMLALILGYGFGSVLSPFSQDDASNEKTDKPVLDFPDAVEVQVPVGAENVEKIAKLEQERDKAVAELNEMKTALDNARAEIASQVAEMEKLKSGSGSEGQRPRSQQDWSQRWKERQEQLKKENPEEYEAHQKQIKEFQDRMDGAVAEKSAFLVNLDTSDMTEQEKKDHEELLGRVAEAWELMNNMQQGKFPSGEQWGAIGDNMTAIRDLYRKERDYVLRKVGKDLGYDDVKAAEFSTQMQDIFEKTSPTLPIMGMGHRGGRHRPGGERTGSNAQPGGGTAPTAPAQPL